MESTRKPTGLVYQPRQDNATGGGEEYRYERVRCSWFGFKYVLGLASNKSGRYLGSTLPAQ